MVFSWSLHVIVMIKAHLGLFHITAVRTLAYDDPLCSRSLTLSALVFGVRLNRPHSCSPSHTCPVCARAFSFCFCLSRPAYITSGLPRFQSKDLYDYWTVPPMSLFITARLQFLRQIKIKYCVYIPEQTQHRDGKSQRGQKMKRDTVKVGAIIITKID